jgi:hypothetical protein
VVMIYTATAMIGTYTLTWVSKKYGLYNTITFLLSSGIVLQALLVLGRGIVDFTVIRSIQTGLIAAVIPLTISFFASDSGGERLGFLNSARYAGNALGPIFATTVLAYSNLTTLYLFISAITLSAFIGFRAFFK